MQLTNRENTWLRFETDMDWVYDYDAWHTQLVLRTRRARDSDRAAI
jgi:hypothetical protein